MLPTALATGLARILTRPRLPLLLMLAGVLLASPAVRSGWQVDDHFQRWILLGGGSWSGISATPGDLFSFIDGDPERNRRLVDFGIFPWWTAAELRIRFFRPLAVLTHRLDYLLWPGSAVAMHLHSLAWFAAVIGAAAVFYRRVLGVGVAAGLAAFFFALDDAHGIPAGWLANRNALLGLFFGIAALLAHQQARRGGGRAAACWSPGLFALSLLSSESAVAGAGYLASFAVFLDRAPWRARLRALLPHLGVGALWLALLRGSGYGAAYSGDYLDPLRDSGAYLSGLPGKALLLLLAQWGFPPSGVWVYLDPGRFRWALSGAVFFLVLVGLFLLPLLRRSPAARFFGLGMALSLLPVAATVPDDRLLLWSGLGALGLAGQALAPFFDAAPGSGGSRILRWARGALASLLLLIHAVLAPLLLPVVARSMSNSGPLAQDPALGLAAGEELRSQDLVILDHPLPYFAGYLIAVRETAGRSLPRAVRVLAPASGVLKVSRPDARTLLLEPQQGFLSGPFDTLFRSPGVGLDPGTMITLTGLTVEVGALRPDGRPAAAAFRFAVPLEDTALRWCRWSGGAYVPFTPPDVGRAVTLAAAPPWADPFPKEP